MRSLQSKGLILISGLVVLSSLIAFFTFFCVVKEDERKVIPISDVRGSSVKVELRKELQSDLLRSESEERLGYALSDEEFESLLCD